MSAMRLRALVASLMPSAVVAEAEAAAGMAGSRTLELMCPSSAAAELTAFFREAQQKQLYAEARISMAKCG